MMKLLAVKYTLTNAVRKLFTRKEEGAALVEYGILVGLIAVVAIGAVAALGTELRTVFNTIVNDLTGNNV
jgi:pilus assembly protein Flp/PilA